MLAAPRDRRSIPRWADATDAEWDDWRWQLRNRVDTPEALEQVVGLTDDERRAARSGRGLFRLGITPHYATLLDPRDPACPLRLQAVPRTAEFRVADFEARDPLDEDGDAPVPGVVHRYPDRCLLLVTHECALYCRYCTRRRIVGDRQGSGSDVLDSALAYIARTPAIRDVLVSGGDPLALPDARLEHVLARLRAMPHVEVVRIGSRMPVVMPQRITRELVAILARHHPLWFNTHFNHPAELAHPAAQRAMERLADSGIPTGNQTVLLRGVNDCPAVMKRLVHALTRVRCRPYYLYACDLSEGLAHFRTSVARGLEIIEALRGHTSGFAVPTFVIDAPGGGGKVAIEPNRIVAHDDGRVALRTFDGRTVVYHEGTYERPRAASALVPLRRARAG